MTQGAMMTAAILIPRWESNSHCPNAEVQTFKVLPIIRAPRTVPIPMCRRAVSSRTISRIPLIDIGDGAHE